MSFSLLCAVLTASAWAVVEGPQGTVKAELFAPEYAALPVAKVDSRVVTLKDLSDALSVAHETHSTGAHAGKKDFTPVLDRLIGMQLIALEAHDMGIDELPDIKEEMARQREAGMREVLKARIGKGIEADPAEVDARYKESIREWKVRSVLVPVEADAKALLASLQSGKTWEETVKAAIAAKKVTGGEENEIVSRKVRALPAVLDALGPVKAGAVAGPVRLEKGFALLHVDEIRYPEDPQIKEEAEAWSKTRRQTAAVYKRYQELLKTRAKTNDKLYKAVDFHAKKPGFKALLKDKRALVRIEGDSPVTVGDLAQALSDEFFHGIDRAIQEKKVNARKAPVFENLVYQRLFDAEARREKIGQSVEYLKLVNDHHDALVFAKFVEKVILPDLKITEGDLKKYYDEHAAKFTYPTFYTLSSIAFEKVKGAQTTLDKLRAGTDFKWLKSNADGQLAEGHRAFEFDGSTVSARALPPDLAKVLSSARAGDVRLFSTTDGGHYVIQVKAVAPPSPQPYAEARVEIAPVVQRERVRQALDEWIGKLRKAREVKVYITQITS